MDYRELKFYQTAREVSIGINNEIKKWPSTLQTYSISRQLFRAATSVGANIAEGHGRHIGLEYIHYLRISQGSANEVDHWLNTALDIHIGSPEELRRLINRNNETRKMLSATIKTLQKKTKQTREPLIPYSFDPSPLSAYDLEDETP